MRNKRLTVFCAVVMIALVPTYALCRAAGRMYGRVIDAQTGESLPGANVLIEGTSLGAATNLNGRYTVPSIPPGSYTVRVTYVGYRSLSVKMKEGSAVMIVKATPMIEISKPSRKTPTADRAVIL